MKLRATEERMVIVSDLHLGSPSSRALPEFAGFLEAVAQSGRALCVNGDGFDLLQSTPTALATSAFPVLRELQGLADGGVPVYYVLGNHDLALEHVLFDLPFTVSPFLNLRSGDQLIRIEHGHVYEPFFARHPHLYELGGQLGRLALVANADAYEIWARMQQRLDDRRRLVSGKTYPHHAAAMDLFRRGFDAVVFGHTHQPEVVGLDGGTFVNDGDWMKRRTYVTIDAGALALHEWVPGEPLA